MLKNKVVVVSGGVGLLGTEFVRSIISNGGIPIIADINIDRGIKLQNELIKEFPKGKALAVQLDINDKNNINSCINLIKNKFYRIDALVNNAYPRNKNYGRHLEDVEYSDFCENLNLNLGGYFLMCQQFAIFFKKQNKGNIVNISSIYGVIPPKFEVYENTAMTMPVEYAAIKSGLIHLTKYFAKFYRGYNIRVNTLSPGGILNGQPELFQKQYKRFSLNIGMLDKSDISGTLLYLLSDLSQYINGQNIIIDDGFTL